MRGRRSGSGIGPASGTPASGDGMAAMAGPVDGTWVAAAGAAAKLVTAGPGEPAGAGGGKTPTAGCGGAGNGEAAGGSDGAGHAAGCGGATAT